MTWIGYGKIGRAAVKMVVYLRYLTLPYLMYVNNDKNMKKIRNQKSASHRFLMHIRTDNLFLFGNLRTEYEYIRALPLRTLRIFHWKTN